jgi:hypothetical protein
MVAALPHRLAMSEGPPIQLLDLGAELLLAVLAHLGPIELVRAAATCRELSTLAHDDGLWRSICAARWHNVHATQSRQSHSRLYARNNGWREPCIAPHVIRAAKGDFISAVHACSAPQGGATHLALANSGAVELWGLRAEGEGLSSRLLGSHTILPGAIVHSLAMPSPQLVLTGDNWGAIEVLQLRQQAAPGAAGAAAAEGSAAAAPALAKLASLRSPAITVPAVSLCALDGGQRLAALHDATFSLAAPAGQRNWLRLLDLEAQRELRHWGEHLESYELVALGQLGAGAQQGGAQLVAGAVHGTFCRECYDAGVPSLCWHKSQVGEWAGGLGRCLAALAFLLGPLALPAPPGWPPDTPAAAPRRPHPGSTCTGAHRGALPL